jgi:hypothetical protein
MDKLSVTLQDPMSLIFTEDGTGRSVIFLTRYSPFTGNFPVMISLEKCVYAASPTPNVIEYYNRTVEYSELRMDGAFADNILEARDYVDQLIQDYMIKTTGEAKLHRPKGDAGVVPSDPDNVDPEIAFYHAASDTKH